MAANITASSVGAITMSFALEPNVERPATARPRCGIGESRLKLAALELVLLRSYDHQRWGIVGPKDPPPM